MAPILVNNFSDIAVALKMLAAECFNYSGSGGGVTAGTYNPGTGDFPETGTRETQSAWMVKTFGSGFGFPIVKSAADGGYVPDAVNDNRGPARGHGAPSMSGAILASLGLPFTYQLSVKDTVVITYIPALYDHLVALMLAPAGVTPVGVPSNAGPVLVSLAHDLNQALANAANSLAGK